MSRHGHRGPRDAAVSLLGLEPGGPAEKSQGNFSKPENPERQGQRQRAAGFSTTGELLL